ncbi:MAG: divergent polysaccharide deacetylase family protein [Deltaproteobacteria bacterium]|nr:divergent polysaccharide deacetylase family protein [Deltaproteobacteria bacterium]
MAKAKSKGRKKKPSKRKPVRQRIVKTPQLVRIIAGLSILILLVAAAGILAHQLLKRKDHQHRAYQADNRQSSPKTEAPFEIYPVEDPPPAKPETKPLELSSVQLPKVAIIVDDVGNDRKMARKFMKLDSAITISILPQSTYTRQIAQDARKYGLEIMLHQPMEPNEYPRVNPGPGVLLTAMSPDAIIEQLNANLDALPEIKGVNNHMGSKMTANSPQMRQIFSVLKKRGLFFIDSRTTSDSKCRLSASLLQVPFAERDVFIDHRHDSDFIRKQLKALLRIAKKHGMAIGIAHPHNSTYEVLLDTLPAMKKQVEIVPVSQIVRIVF